MKKNLLKKAFTGTLAAILGFSFTPVTKPMAANAADLYEQGTHGGLDWELLNEDDKGTAKMELKDYGGFIAEWNKVEYYHAKTGKKWDSDSLALETVDNIEMYYDVDYKPDGYSYLASYGWTKNSLVEFFIIENYGTWRPPGGQGSVATITVNGHIYDVYKIRSSDESVAGGDSFLQYFSVRRDNDKGTNGKIDISEHFRQWEKLGLDLGKELCEVSLVVEGYQSSGYAEVKKNIITIDGKTINKFDQTDDTEIPPEPTKPMEPDENGHYINESFESSTGDFASRGNSIVTNSSNESNSGSKSLAISGRTDSWNGAAINLDEYTFKAGESYGFSVMAMQNETSSEDFNLTLQYTDSSGTEQYADVATATDRAPFRIYARSVCCCCLRREVP